MGEPNKRKVAVRFNILLQYRLFVLVPSNGRLSLYHRHCGGSQVARANSGASKFGLQVPKNFARMYTIDLS